MIPSPRFELLVNDERVALAGLESPGVLSIILASVRRHEDPRPDDELDVRLTGLNTATGHHSIWATLDLSVGDVVTIRVLEPGECDEPDEVVDPSAYGGPPQGGI